MTESSGVRTWGILLIAGVALSATLAGQAVVPGPPSNLQMTASGNVVSVTWGAPASGGPAANYVVIARSVSGTIIFQQNVWPTPSLVGSVPNGTYVVSIRAENVAGAGPETVPVTITVPSLPPPGQGAPGVPTNFQASVSGNTVSLSWGAPTTGGAPGNYVVVVRTTAGGTILAQNVWPTPSLIVGAVPNGEYAISVQATNASGAGPETPPRTITVPSAPPPGPGVPGVPTNFQASVNGNALTVSWGAPATGGVPTGYTLTARDAAGVFLASVPLGLTSPFAAGAVPNGVYTLTVRGVNASGAGPESASRTVTVPSGPGVPGVPGPPVNVGAALNGGNVLVNWESPVAGGTPTSYVVRASLAPGGPIVATLPTTGTSAAVPNVAPGTYYITVLAANNFGTSQPSAEVAVPVGGAGTRSTLHPPNPPTWIEGRASMIVASGQDPSKVWDDFVLPVTTSVRQIAWQGTYCIEQNGSGPPPQSATGFVISLHADDNGRPSTATALATLNIPMAQANPVQRSPFAGATCGNATTTTWSVWDYSTTVPVPLQVAANTRYWLSIQAQAPSYASYWSWRAGTPDTRVAYQLFGGSLVTLALDRAFSLAP